MGQPEPAVVECVWCAIPFQQLSARARFCGVKCIDAEKHYRKQQTPEYRAARAAYEKKYGAANIAKIRQRRARHRAAYPEVSREKTLRYRALRKSATLVVFTSAQMMARLAMWGGKCWMCGDVATAVDHVKPLSKGGAHMLANFRPACISCNSSKGGRWFGPAELHRFIRN